MRRLLLLFVLTALGAAAFTAGAFAKEGGVELSSTPFGLGPGDPWNGTLTVFSDEGGFPGSLNPSITIRNLETGAEETFPVTTPAKEPSTENARSFVFEATFPTEGRYRYTVTDGVSGREYEFPIVRIVGSATLPVAASPPASTPDGSFPLWPLLGGLAGASALGAAAFFALRSRRFAH
jgi:hypothetical protein